VFEQAKTILMMIGEYFQIQDDYLDCYGKLEDIGKEGSDIQDNKCSWLVVKALEIASPVQRKVGKLLAKKNIYIFFFILILFLFFIYNN
jgi:geranylgeranyl pyrophosphate synthase